MEEEAMRSPASAADKAAGIWEVRGAMFDLFKFEDLSTSEFRNEHGRVKNQMELIRKYSQPENYEAIDNARGVGVVMGGREGEGHYNETRKGWMKNNAGYIDELKKRNPGAGIKTLGEIDSEIAEEARK